MKKTLLLITMISMLFSCSKDDDLPESCDCQHILFKATVNRDQGVYRDYTTTDCLARWEDPGYLVTIDYSTSPVTIYGPSEEQVQVAKFKNNLCD